MSFLRPARIGAVLLGTFLMLLGSGCSRENKMMRIQMAVINQRVGANFTCWIQGEGFQSGDKVRINDSTDVETAFGGPELVTIAAPLTLLEGRRQIRIMVFRPRTETHSNIVDIPVPQAWPAKQ